MGFYRIEIKLILKSECKAVFKVRMTKFRLCFIWFWFLNIVIILDPFCTSVQNMDLVKVFLKF